MCGRCSILLVALFAAACSTTRRLAEGEVLYTGVRRIRIEPDSGVHLAAAAESALKEPLSVAPNNPLYSPYLRTGFPVGLWAYNHLYTPRERGFKYWFYKRLAKDPVLVSRVQPELRAEVAADVLGDYGHFGSTVEAAFRYRKKGRKAKVGYTVRVAPAWYYSSIGYPAPDAALQPLFDSLRATSLLRTGAQYNLDTLTLERRRVTQILRNRGRYYFRVDYLEFLVDTTIAPRRAAVRLAYDRTAPAEALRPYRVGEVSLHLKPLQAQPADTLSEQGLRIIGPQPLPVRQRLLARSVALREGALFRVDDQSATLVALNKLGIFRSVSLAVAARDSLRGGDSLAVRIEAQMDRPIEVAVETDVTSKSNSFVGPGLALRVSHNNLFRGAEVLSLRLNGSYEWRTGNRGGGSRLNSYELGLHASLRVPRLLPAWLGEGGGHQASTAFDLGVDLMNRPDYFRLIAFSGSAGYDFRTSPSSRHGLTLLRLAYNKLLHTTAAFDRTLDENPVLAMSFRSRFIPSMNYTWTFDRTCGPKQRNRLLVQTSVTSAGNLLSGLLRLFGERQPQHLFGNRFSQFVKGSCEVRYYLGVGRRNNLIAMRLLIGAGYAYGNSDVLPYSEQFYIGGANSIRAFAVRSIGPGGYRPASGDRNGYLDQTGDFKLEANAEFRFGLLGRLNGALFLDAGNIWLLHRDPDRPDAVLRWRTLGREIALGTGFGLRYDLGFLVLRGDLGVALHAPWANPDRRGYYNITRFGDGLSFHLAIGYPF